MRILITGANGQLGFELRQVFSGHDLVLCVRPEFDVLRPEVQDQVLAAKPDVVIHAAAYTDVDGAEGESEQAMAVNAEGTERIARAAAQAGARLIYLSTDYVFDGLKGVPYDERDQPNPLNVYGRSKLEGERLALRRCPNTLIARTSWLYGANGKNFVKTIMRLAQERPELRVVADQRGCPTYARDLAIALSRMAKIDLRGIVHATGTGECTWHEFACAIVSLMGVPVAVHPITAAEARRPAPRPAYSVLGNRVLAGTGIVLPHWKEAIGRFVNENRAAPAAGLTRS
jgi:dTDP-4-dehydrorhamnose reductase